MGDINIIATNQTPEIIFNFKKGEISIKGKSYPENVPEIYQELIDAIESYCKAPQKKTVVNFNWLYYNTATSKIIIKILMLLKKADTTLVVNWVCKKDFTMMIEKANIIKDVMKIDIKVIEA